MRLTPRLWTELSGQVIMGRTLITFRMLLEREKNNWKNWTKKSNYSHEAQSVQDQAQKYADASTYWSPGQVQEKILFSIFFSQYITTSRQLRSLKQ